MFDYAFSNSSNLISVHNEVHPSIEVPLESFLSNSMTGCPQSSGRHRARRGLNCFQHSNQINESNIEQHLDSKWRNLKFLLRICVVGILGVMNIFNFWLATSDAVAVSCEIALQSNSTWFAGLCQSKIATASSRSRQGILGRPDPYHSHWSQKIDEISTRLKNIDDILGLDTDVDLDLSLRGRGAQLVQEFTSPTPSQSTGSTWSIWSMFSGSNSSPQVDFVLPIVVLEEPVILGECWEFPGRVGRIGIRLPSPANITALSVDYIPPRRLTGLSKRMTPRSFALWGLMRTSESLQFSSSHLHPTPRRPIHDFLPSGTTTVSAPFQKDDVFISILRAEYAPEDGRFKKVCFREEYSFESNRTYDTVVVEILDNWGANATCLYHVGIHGLVVEE